MREIISDSWAPCLVFSSAGQLQLLRTGADGYAEHNDPAEYLLPKFCPGASNATDMAVRPVTQGHLMAYVSLPLNSASQPEAVMGYNGPAGPWFNGTEERPLDHRYVLQSLTSFHDDAAAALAWGNFAIRVRGAANVKALAEFHAAVLAGHVVMVIGSRHRGNPHGVAFVNLKALSKEELASLEADVQGFLKDAFRRSKV